MAEYKNAISFTLSEEKGYEKDPSDTGGETYAGISRKYNPNFGGWELVDKHKPLEEGQLIDDSDLLEMICKYYNIHYWKQVLGDAIGSEKVAAFLFDWYVNAGKPAIELTQQLLGIVADGIMGTKTVYSINNCIPESLYQKLKTARIDYYKRITVKNPQNERFLNGWLNRVNNFDKAFATIK